MQSLDLVDHEESIDVELRRSRDSYGELYGTIMDRFMRRLIDPRVNPIFEVDARVQPAAFPSRDASRVSFRSGNEKLIVPRNFETFAWLQIEICTIKL